MTKDKKILLHYEVAFMKWGEIEIILREREEKFGGYEGAPTDYEVIINDEVVDILTRDPRHRTYQVHNRLRYDNKQTTRFRAQKHGLFYQDTRNEALGDILEELGMTRERHSVHIPGKRGWRSCSICKGKS